MELDFSYVRCWFNICFLKFGRIIIMDRMEYGLEAEQLWCCVWSALSIIRLNILRQYWDLSVRMRLVRLLDGIEEKGGLLDDYNNE